MASMYLDVKFNIINLVGLFINYFLSFPLFFHVSIFVCSAAILLIAALQAMLYGTCFSGKKKKGGAQRRIEDLLDRGKKKSVKMFPSPKSNILFCFYS